MVIGGAITEQSVEVKCAVTKPCNHVEENIYCCLHLELDFSQRFYDKGDVYRYLNESCKSFSDRELDNLTNFIKSQIVKAFKEFNGAAQATIIVRSRKTAIPLAIVSNGKAKTFHVLTEALFNCKDPSCVIEKVMSYILKTFTFDEIFEMKIQIEWGWDNITLRYRCPFNEKVIEAIVLNATLLSIFVASSRNPQS
jgi:hypothetical protein